MLLATLLACETPKIGPGDDDPDPTESPTLAGCTTSVSTASDDVTSETMQRMDAEGRIVAWSLEAELADGVTYGGEGTFTWDDAGCLTAESSSSGYSTPLDRGDTYWTEESTEESSTCDERANAVRTEGATSEVTGTNDDSAEPTTTAWADTFENTYDGDLLVDEAAARDDGTTWRYAYAYDRDGEMIEARFYDPADATEPEWVRAWELEGGLVVGSVYTSADVTESWSYTHDDLDRTARVVHDAAGMYALHEVSAYTYDDDEWRWPAVVTVDEGDDGTVDATLTYTYDCP